MAKPRENKSVRPKGETGATSLLDRLASKLDENGRIADGFSHLTAEQLAVIHELARRIRSGELHTTFAQLARVLCDDPELQIRTTPARLASRLRELSRNEIRR